MANYTDIKEILKQFEKQVVQKKHYTKSLADSNFATHPTTYSLRSPSSSITAGAKNNVASAFVNAGSVEVPRGIYSYSGTYGAFFIIVPYNKSVGNASNVYLLGYVSKSIPASTSLTIKALAS